MHAHQNANPPPSPVVLRAASNFWIWVSRGIGSNGDSDGDLSWSRGKRDLVSIASHHCRIQLPLSRLLLALPDTQPLHNHLLGYRRRSTKPRNTFAAKYRVPTSIPERKMLTSVLNSLLSPPFSAGPDSLVRRSQQRLHWPQARHCPTMGAHDPSKRRHCISSLFDHFGVSGAPKFGPFIINASSPECCSSRPG